ncbi:ribosomal protein L7/L12 [Litoribacillus peritrichatus]|uniref:Large ribosomal subunit protein bL12 C-terminal domain-containing protein n=1 Tax=Litoribacillus peritrichatus TaxID=718191 RepID=A0ABP7MNI1_9GAMM
MNDLSPEVTDAINRGRKIEAIKILREQQNLGLKEAKDIIDQYITDNPDKLSTHANPKGKLSWSLIMMVIILAAIFWVNR